MRIINRAPLAAKVSANVTTAQIFPNSITTTKPCILQVPGSGRMEAKLFEIRASGYVVTNATTNVTVTLYSGTSLTAGSNTVIKASTARAQNSAKAPFCINAWLIFDSVSGFLHGTMDALVNNLYDAPAAVTNVVSSVAGATEPCLSFCLGVTFSAADAGNYAVLSDFSLGL